MPISTPQVILSRFPVFCPAQVDLIRLVQARLTLNALNTYSGNTIIKGGTLEIAHGIASSGTSLIDVQSGTATFKTTPISKTNLNINTAALATFEVVNGANVDRCDFGRRNHKSRHWRSLTAASINQGTLTIGSDATVTIQAIPGGPQSGAITPVPGTDAVILFLRCSRHAVLCLGEKSAVVNATVRSTQYGV